MVTIYDAKLLLVDDNAELLALLCEQLRGAGYGHIRTAQSCAAARACFAAEQPELMILDINLPDGDGFSLFRALRAKADVPALFLSARDADADRLFGLGLGADDYLTKPFLMQELLLRVQHILQRAYRAELSRTKPAPLQLGERCVDLNDAIVTLPEGKTLALTATELALLRKLAENRGHIVRRTALMDTIYDAKFLVVDDNAELLALLCEQLRGAGYGYIRTAQSCAAARACFAAEQPELMILDINLPDGDGFSLFRALRAKADVPALFLSARDADADRLFGLGLGADDYLTKPFLMQELLLRVQHILQRAYRAELSRTKPAPLQLGERCVDLNDAIVTLPEGKTLALTATELALLRKLAENRGHIVTYDALCAAVWDADYYGYENSLGVHIRHLREKLEAEPGAPQFLRTVRGIGYKLTKGEEA